MYKRQHVRLAALHEQQHEEVETRHGVGKAGRAARARRAEVQAPRDVYKRQLLHFAILAFFIGCFQGSIQSLSRSYYSKIIPAENSGEYFGIYDIFSKGASFLGSAVIAAVKLAGGTINVAVACLAVFFALGFLFLRIADKQKAIR